MDVESDEDGEAGTDPLPEEVVEEAARLTRLAREADQREASERMSGDAAAREADQREASERTSGDAAAREADQREASERTSGEATMYRTERDDLLAESDYTARVREDDTGAVLVLHPDEWIDEGTARIERIQDLSRGIEVQLSGPGEGTDWEAVEAHNREIAETVAEIHGEPHGATAHALADFASNHYAKRLGALTVEERREFREEYFPRNAWPTRAQRETLAESVRLTLAASEGPGLG